MADHRNGADLQARYDAVYAAYKQFINPPLARFMKVAGAPIEVEARGARVRDHRGKWYLDFCGGYGVFVVGHMHPKVVAAVRAQLERMALSTRVFFNEQMAMCAKALADLAPGDLQISFFGNSGTEAVEAALKLARVASGKTRIVSTINAFHGKTLGSLSATGREAFQQPFAPLVPDFDLIPFGDLDALARALPGAAAFIVEPIQCEGGVIVPPDGYLRGVRALCDEHGALFIADEVQTGLGRTGAMWGVDHERVVPDIMAVAKGISGGVVPIGVCISKADVWNAGYGRAPLIHTSTFGGNPLACAAALAALEVIVEERLADNARVVGDYMLARVRELAATYPEVVADVRGRGLVVGVELTSEGYGGAIIPECLKRGLTVAYTLNMQRVIRLEPPLIVTKDDVDEAMESFGQGLRAAREKLGSLAVRQDID